MKKKLELSILAGSYYPFYAYRMSMLGAQTFDKLGRYNQFKLLFSVFSVKDGNGTELFNLETMIPDYFEYKPIPQTYFPKI